MSRAGRDRSGIGRGGDREGLVQRTPRLRALLGEKAVLYVPLSKGGKPREIVNAALFLASDESSFVNGAAFVVDGGLTAAYVTPE